MTIPPRPPYLSTSCNNSVLAGDSSSGSDWGITHFIMAIRNTTEEWETKNKRTMWAWDNSKCKKGGSVTLNSLCICRLTLACISDEISTKLIGMPTHPDWPSLTASFCWPSVDCHSALPFANCLLRVPFPNHWLAFPCPLPVSSKIPSSGLCLVFRKNRQRYSLLSGLPTHWLKHAQIKWGL